MSSQNQNPKELLAQGNLESALEALVRLSQHTDDADLRKRVLTLSGQFAALKKQYLTGLLEDKDYHLQLNRITAAVAEMVDNQQLPESFKLSGSSQPWKKWAAILAVLASIAGITGYTLRDFFWPKPAPVETPAVEPRKTDTIVVKTPVVPAAPAGKNNVKIEVKDKAKVGTIITGDSNKIDVKQDF
ncbi:MAG: hypothetical protein H7246_17890 [Phycisphaerae bacterium]|nr:hypothetical protein [Saprospiraceae bacterium]